ncbi:MAG: PorT family protein [Bacteroidales bacterium]|nr:PorT family protein [Bacteroidales bacterium]
MKKKFFFIIILSFFFVQNIDAQSFNGGVLAGAVTSQVNGDGYAGFHQLGWTAGAYVGLPIGENFTLQTELKYSLFGSHSDVKEEEYGLNYYNLRLHYVEMPIMFRYNLGNFTVSGNNLDFITLEIGPSLDFLMRYRDETAYSPNQNAPWLFFSITGNLGIHFDLSDRLGLGVRSMNSLTPIRLKGEVPLYSWNHYYNIALQAVITYNIKAPNK